jgi:hypothetical protein
VDTLRFATNQVLGEVMKPTVLSLDGTTSLDGEDELVESSFTVYPNPASGLVYFDFSARANEVLLLTVRDPLGREVDRVKLDNPTTRNRLEWNVRNLPAGVYLVTLEQGGHRRSLRLSIK